jgi:carbon monoxide dehydrogenase subunit G
MEMSGEQLISAPRQKVWEALNNPEILKQCIPGCEEINKTSDTEMDAKVAAKVGPVKARFSGAVTLSEIDAPNGYRISGEGKGGAAGFAKGGATVKLSDADGGTLLKYDVDAQVGGKLAQIGARLIDSTAKKYANDFFTKFNEVVGSSDAEAPAAEPESKTKPTSKPTSKPTASTSSPREGENSMRPSNVPEENVYHGYHWSVLAVVGLAAACLIWFLAHG